jgi:uncharacterized protein (TIGR03000 family)
VTTPSDSSVSGNGTRPERIDRLFTKFARLSDTELPPAEDYFGLLVDGIEDIVRPAAAAIWWRGSKDHPELIDQVDLDKSGVQSEANKAHHEQLLREAFDIPRPLVLPPHGRADESQGAAPLSVNATDYTAIIVPILIEHKITGLIEVWLGEADRPENRPATIQFLVHMAYLASLYLRNRELHRLRTLEEQWKRWQTFIERVHRGLGPADVASVLADESRTLIGCDRSTVALRRNGRARIIGLSGPGAMEQRSKIGQCLRRLLQEVDQSGQPVIMAGQIESEWPASIQKAVEEYVGAGGGPWIFAQPLRDDRRGRERFQGVMVLEWLHGEKAPEPAMESLERLFRDATTALSNASLFQAARRRPTWKTVLAETAVAIVLGVAAGGLFLYGARLMAERRAQERAIAMLDQTKLVDGERDNAIVKLKGALTESQGAFAARDRAAGERDHVAQKLKSALEEKSRWEEQAGRLGGEVSRLSGERDREAAQLKSTVDERDQYARRYAEIQKERDQARRDLAAAQESAKLVKTAAVAPADIPSFNVDKMKQERETVQRELADINARLKATVAERDRLQKKQLEVETEREWARAQSKSVEAAFHDAKKRLQELEERAGTSAKLIDSLQARLTRASGDAQASAALHQETDKKAAALKHEAARAIKEAALTRTEVERLEKQLADARLHADLMSNRLKQTEVALAKAQDQLFEQEWAAMLASQQAETPADNDGVRMQAKNIRLTSRTVDRPPQSAMKKAIDPPVLDGTEDYAVITVLMPSEGALTFEGDDAVHPSEQRGEKRVFRTPGLQAEDGTTYYIVAASWTMNNGETVNRRRRVLVEAGKTYNLDLRSR